MTNMFGVRLASKTVEGKGYFFTSLDILDEHFRKGLFIGGRKSNLVGKTEISMESLDCGLEADLLEIIEDCNVYNGSDICGEELRVSWEIGNDNFLRFVDACRPIQIKYVYTVTDIN